jgi:hypothetical protein
VTESAVTFVDGPPKGRIGIKDNKSFFKISEDKEDSNTVDDDLRITGKYELRESFEGSPVLGKPRDN